MIRRYLCPYYDPCNYIFLVAHFSWVYGQMMLPTQNSKITNYLKRGNTRKVIMYKNSQTLDLILVSTELRVPY